jgi:putative DNA primase/helicase
LDVATIGATIEDDDPASIPFLRFTIEAQAIFDEWRGKLEHRLRSGELPTVMEAHLAKYRSLIPSLALLIHLADDGQGSVGLVPLRKAIRWGEYLETHARRIFAVAADTRLASARALSEKIIDGTLGIEFALKDVYRPGWAGLPDSAAAEQAVDYLVDLDWLRVHREPTRGAPRTRYFVNPKIAAPPQADGAKSAKSPAEPFPAPPSGSYGSPDVGQCAEKHGSTRQPTEEACEGGEETYL